MPAIACAAFHRIDARQPVEARHVGDRRHHDDVGNIDEGATSPEASVDTMIFGRPSGRRAHAGRDDRGSAAAADADDAGDVAARLDEAREGLAHRGHRRAAIVAAEHGAGALRMVRGDLAMRRRRRRSSGVRVPMSTRSRQRRPPRLRRPGRPARRPWCRPCRPHRRASCVLPVAASTVGRGALSPGEAIAFF